MNASDLCAAFSESHAAVLGASGVGKSVFLQILADGLARDPRRGFTVICPHGTARAVAERLANPARCSGRIVHLLDPNSEYTFGVSPFETEEHSWESAHEASLLWTSSVASLYGTAMQETPRLEKNFYVLGMFAAFHQLTLLELLAALSLAGERVREFLLTSFDNAPVRAELEDLHQLAAKSPARFLEQTESCRNRLVRWSGGKRLARIVGRSKGNVNPRKIMDERAICLVDLAGMDAADAAFVGTILTCKYFAAAKRRPPNHSAMHHLIIDEAASMLCTATADMLDQSRKFGLLGIFSLQRIGQLRDKGENILDALMVNTGVKAVFRSPEPLSARYLADYMFTGHVPLNQWKTGSERATVTGLDLVTTKSRSRAQHHAVSVGEAASDVRSHGRMASSTEASISAWAAGHSTGDTIGYSGTPTTMPFSPMPALAQSTGRNSQRSASASDAFTAARSTAHHSAHARAASTSRSVADGSTHASAEAEVYIPRYENLPAQLFSLEEQMHRATGEIMSLPKREFFLKLAERAPLRQRTPDLAPAFNSAPFQALIWPRFERALQSSEYLAPAADIDAEIAARLQRITMPPVESDHDFGAAEPFNLVDHPEAYARDFLRNHPPTGDAAATTAPFRIIRGGKDTEDKP